MVKIIRKPTGKNIMDNHNSEPGHQPTKYDGDGLALPKAFTVGPNPWSPRKRAIQAREDATMKSMVKKLMKSKKKHEKLTKKMAAALKEHTT